MSSEWETTTLGDLLTLQRGMDLPVQSRHPGIFPIIASTGVVGFHNVGPVKGPGVVIGRSGSIGGGQFIESDFWPLNTTLWVKDFKKNDPRFCYYLLRSIDFGSLNVGSGVPTLNRNHVHPLPVNKPPLKDQREISILLGTLDDRIALLRETNKTLEAIAQAIFKSWFVDFDPVRAKMEGRQPEGMDEATAALFPDSFEESELGLVPKGWNTTRLDSVLELKYGKALKADNRKPGAIPVYGSGGITGWHDTALVEKPSIIVGRKGTVGSLYWESRPFFPIDTVFYVHTNLPLTYCYQLLKTLNLHDMNTDAAVPGLNRDNVYRLLVPSPSLNVLSAFNEIADSLRRRIDHNEEEAQNLAEIRDTLLPRLISGQLRLPEAQEQIENA